ncbi:MAG: DNA polymerase III subunit alpha [Candidatus Peregrinibacteria bacterium Greene0416_62]|nr:MAG: DNA polymerase III subunit alpha [Candidatus Peregrinibacteria bacterium Greene0416_62]
MRPEDFVHLHCHSTYSLLEALPSPEEIAQRAEELGQSAVGIADKGFTYGLIEFYKACKARSIKPILGIEVYIAARTRNDKESGVDAKRWPLVLLAENNEGYRNLLELVTKAAVEGMYYKPRVDRELLEKYGNGLIALSGPISGALPQAALAEDGERIRTLTKEYHSYFGKDNLYFELMDLPSVPGQIEANQQLIHWGKELGVPLVATCNAHYCRQGDAEAHDVLLCIQKNAQVGDPSRFSMRDADYSMRPFSEMQQSFAHVPEALENTRSIADRCNVELQFSSYHIPRFPVPQGTTESKELRRLTEEGFVRRYLKPTQQHRERMDYELKIIDQVGFSGYFLIVADFVNEAKRRSITVGPGRGSAAGSLVSYCLGITGLDPLEYGLLFERFLNPERISMPDVDIDFADTRRDEVLEYVRDKYGQDRVVQICTFGTLAARAAVKDVGRAYGVPFLEMNALVKLIPDRPGTTLDEALETQELKTIYQENEAYRRIFDAAKKLEGKARHVSVHACGVIITPEPAVCYTALQRAPKDENIIITQTAAKPLESLGLLKMDFLGLMNLTVIQTTLEIIERLSGRRIDITSMSVDDARTYALLQRGDTTGVFQLESAGMRRYLKQLKPTAFNDIIAMVALYRPGPMEWIAQYIKRKHGQESVRYLHEDLRTILEPTYGIGVYQEQILEIARTFAGFSLGEADILRRAIGKKIKEELASQREKFLTGSVRKGYKHDLAEQIFDDVVTPFAGYGFNKSHAAGYARIAYETAWLKAHYPTEFMAALLSSDAADTDRVMIEIEECRAMGIAVLPPDINESLRHFTAIPGQTKKDAGSIRFGLSAIKGIGDSSVLQIIEARGERKFENLEDFAGRVPTKALNKKLLESLAKSGALSSLGEAKAAGDVSKSQGDLFGSAQIDEARITFPKTAPASVQQMLQWEKETLGMYVSSHPLAGLKKYIGKKAQLIANLTKDDAGKKITLAGIVEGVKRITTKKGETMAIVFLEDPTGKIEVTLFPRTFADAAVFLEQPDTVLVVGGVLDIRGGMLQMRVDAVKRASLTMMITKAKEAGFFDEEEAAQGIRLVRPVVENAEAVDALDEEGNVIAGETVILGSGAEEKTDDFFGPIGKWILQGMPIDKELTSLGLADSTTPIANRKSQIANHTSTLQSAASPINIYTIPLPELAPKEILLDLERVLEMIPGREKVQLKIGAQTIDLPLTVTTSTILEKKVEEVIAEHMVA